jgi:hypothetical protein
VLVAIVAVALIGRTATSAETRPGADPAVAVASVAVDSLAPVVAPVPTPSRRSDWPAAIGERRAASRPPREEGTDGLMGGLPFGIPGDTPTIHLERVNRFTIDDAVLTLSRR